MKQQMKKILTSLAVVAALLFPVLQPVAVSAINPFGACSGNDNSSVCRARGTDNVFSIVKSVINILLTIVGIVSVVLIIIGGIKYTTSAGDSNGVNSAKNTVLYAVVGLVVAAMAFAIVNFVIGYLFT